jgi:dephospho-CoA kinase
VGRWKDKYVIGLTGNIATGKSLVRRMLEHLGAYSIDADGLTHRVMEPNAPAYQLIVDTFGKFVLREDGQINRERLGAIAFGHPDALRELEKITHPTIRNAIDTLISRANHPVVVVEAIKLLEGGLADSMDAVWVVDAPPQIQVERLMSKRNLSQQDSVRRVNAQNPQADKIARANVVIRNTGTPDEVWTQVQAAFAKIAPEAPKVAVVETPAAPPITAPGTVPTPPTVTQPPTAVPVTSSVGIEFKRPRAVDFGKIATLLNNETGSNVTDKDIIARFGEKSYLLAEQSDKAIGVIAFLVENLVTRVDEFVTSKSAPMDAVGLGLVSAMEKASDELQSEVVFVFLPKDAINQKQVFTEQGYQEMQLNEVRYPAWREAVNEFYTDNKVLLSKRLRENLILKPI